MNNESSKSESPQQAFEQIENFLGKTQWFCNIPKPILQELSREFSTVYLAGGEVLFNQGEMADCLYVLMAGLLRATKIDVNQNEIIMGEFGPGSVVGEIAILIQEPRTATVHAVRDSVLLKMSRTMFNQFLEKNTLEMMSIVRQCVKRLIAGKQLQTYHVSTIALLPAGKTKQLNNFAQQFAAELRTYGEVIILNQKTFDTMYGVGIAQTAKNSDKNSQIVTWLNELETKYRFIIYEADDELTAWTERCIRQADRIVLLGDYASDAALNSIEKDLFEHKHNSNAAIDLVLLCNSHLQWPTVIKEWLANRNISHHYCVRSEDKQDYAQLARQIIGKGFSVVLSGGGALGLGHVGVLKALEELKIPIDYICGTSMGSIIGALYALGLNTQEMTSKLDEFLTQFTKSRDFTLPFMSLFRAKKLSLLLNNAFGSDVSIEALWRKYFCVSTDLTKNSLYIHNKGLLWRSVRASISLPAFFPPVSEKDGSLLIDGGIVNNLPVDVMKQYNNGGKILASSIISYSQPFIDEEYDYISGWFLLTKSLFKKMNQKNYPNIGDISLRAMLISSKKHQENMLEKADYRVALKLEGASLLDFKKINMLIERGYQLAMEQLAQTDLNSFSRNAGEGI